jgi:hypothetical protein
MALATSFLSVTIIGTQPRTPAAERVALTSPRVDALSNDNPLHVSKRVDVADRNADSARTQR